GTQVNNIPTISTVTAAGGFAFDDGTNALTVSTSIGTTNSPITLVADNMALNGAANSISSGPGLITLAPARTGIQHPLGGNDTPGSVLGFSTAELGTLQTSGGITIGAGTGTTPGAASNTGGIVTGANLTNVTSGLTGAGVLTLISGG